MFGNNYVARRLLKLFKSLEILFLAREKIKEYRLSLSDREGINDVKAFIVRILHTRQNAPTREYFPFLVRSLHRENSLCCSFDEFLSYDCSREEEQGDLKI